MEPKTSTVRITTSALALSVLLLAGACGGEDDERTPVTSKSAASQSPSSGQTTDAPAGARVLLSSNFETGATPPIWQFPVNVTGWEIKVLDQNGINQLAKGGGLFTSSQLAQGTAGGDDAGNSRAYLDLYASEFTKQVQDFQAQEPTTTALASDQGDLEFLQQEATYVGQGGTAYKSRMLVRSLDTNVLILQYAAPESEWSEEEWTSLTKDIRVQLGS
ncbi:MAG TPA: hypothetical protein VIR30_09865 [Nocardioides sp.]